MQQTPPSDIPYTSSTEYQKVSSNHSKEKGTFPEPALTTAFQHKAMQSNETQRNARQYNALLCNNYTLLDIEVHPVDDLFNHNYPVHFCERKTADTNMVIEELSTLLQDRY